MPTSKASARRSNADHTLVALVLFYLGVLLIGGCPSEVRPRVLDRPQYWAQVLLWVTGIRPGIEVFHERAGRDYKFRAHCIRVEARGQTQTAVRLFPSSGGCFTDGVRLRVPPMEVGLYRLMRHAWEVWRGANGILDQEAADRTLGRIGDYYCGRPEVGSLTEPRIYGVWYSYVESYARAGDRQRGGFVYFGWDCTKQELFAREWQAESEPMHLFDQATVTFWHSEPWALD
jgi:hypothetical protein